MRTDGEQDRRRRLHASRVRSGPAAPRISGALEAMAGPKRPAMGLVRAAASLVSTLWSLVPAAILISIATQATADTWRVKDGADVDARTGPGDDYAIVETLRSGAEVEELERVGGWSRVTTPRGSMAFVANSRLVKLGPSGDSSSRDSSGPPEWVVKPQVGHRSPVAGIAFAPDGRTVVSGSFDGSLRLWDVGSGLEIWARETSGGSADPVTFSPDGRTVVIRSHDGMYERFALVDAETGRDAPVDPNWLSRIHALVDVYVSSDGRMVAIASAEELRIWDATTDRELQVLADIGRRSIEGVTFSPDGRTVAIHKNDGAMRAWDIESGRELRFVEGHSSGVASVAFSSDGRILAIGSSDGTVRILHVDSSRQLQVLNGHTGGVESVTFSADGTIVAVTSRDGMVRLWNAETGVELRTFEDLPSSVSDVTLSPDGRTVAIMSSDKTVRLLSAETSQELVALQDVWTNVVFGPQGRTFVVGFRDGTVGIRDAKTGQEIRLLAGNTIRQSDTAFSPVGRLVATLAEDGTIRLWDVESGREQVLLEAQSGVTRSIVFSSDGRTVTSLSAVRNRAWYAEPDTARVWDVETGRQLLSLEDNAFLSGIGNDRMATVTDTGTVRVWDVSTGRKLREFETGSDRDSEVVFSPDVRKMAATSDDGRTRLWDIETGRQLLVLEGSLTGRDFSERGQAFTVSIDGGTGFTTSLRHPDTGRQILAVKEPGVLLIHFSSRVVATDVGGSGLSLWNPEAGWKLLKLELDGSCSGIVFAPDGHTLAAGFEDGAVRLWDASTGRPTLALKAHSRYACDLAFSPDSRSIFTYSGAIEDETGRLWDIASGQLRWTADDWLFSKFESGARFGPSGRFIAIYGPKGVMVLDADSGEYVWGEGGDGTYLGETWFSRDGNTLAVIGSDGESAQGPGIVRNLVAKREFLLDETRPNEDLDFSPDGGTIATLPGQSLWLSDASTGRARAEFLSFSDGSWIVRTPEGFFNASEGGAKHLNLVRGFDVLSIDQVHDALYRPDLVREALAGDPDGKVAAAAARLDLGKVVASGLPPRIVALTSFDGDSVPGDAVDVSAEIVVRNGGVGRVEWRVNGIVQGAETRGLSRPAAQGQETVRLQKRLFLVPGENAVSVAVYNEANLIASDPVEIVVTSTWTEVPRPRLHVLAAGVNDYFDSHLALNYATSDARAIGQALKRAGHGLYDSVEVTYLLDREVSADGLTSAFEKLGREVRPQDVFVFFLAGHGKTVDGRYYFLPRDFRFRDIEDLTRTSISQDQLQSWVAQVSAQKSVLLLDTCESGSLTMEAVPRGLERKTAIDRLSRAVGRTILTASTDTQPALEGFRQHGLFTYTLLEAFAMADTDGDGEVEINELIGYVDERLPVLSEAAFGYRQVPQYKSRGNIFPLGRSVELVSETGRLIPRTATHVVIREAAVYEDLDGLGSVTDTFVPGMMVRVTERSGDWAMIAMDGVTIGWIEISGLATLKGSTETRPIDLDTASSESTASPVSAHATDGWLDAQSAVFRDCEACPEMITVPVGTFAMGSPPHEEARDDNEGPVHGVAISRPFAVGIFEVTRKQYGSFVSATGRDTGSSCWTWEDGGWGARSGLGWKNPGFRQTEHDPVACVSWDDAQAYVGWLSRTTGKRYRLLSEAEWEYAARAGATGPFHFGSTISTVLANYDGNFAYGDGPKGDYLRRSVPVGRFPANSFGLHDVHGNVWEWVEDCWHGDYRGAPSDGAAWITGGDCTNRVVRGGSWLNRPWNLRSSKRGGYSTKLRSHFVGFRVARALAP